MRGCRGEPLRLVRTFPHATVAVIAAHLQVVLQVVNAQVAASSAALLLLLLPLLIRLIVIVISAILLPEAFLQHNAEVIHHLVPPVKRPTMSSTRLGFPPPLHTALLPAPLLFSLFCSESPVLCQRGEVVPAVDGEGLKSTVRTLREDVVGSIFCDATLLLAFEPEKKRALRKVSVRDLNLDSNMKNIWFCLVKNNMKAEQHQAFSSPPFASLAVDLQKPRLVLHFEFACNDTKFLPPRLLPLLFAKLTASSTFRGLLLPIYPSGTHVSFHTSLRVESGAVFIFARLCDTPQLR